MAKLSGSTNYKSPEVRRLLTLVGKYLPLGKDEWERLTVSFNSNRGRSIPERDYESLRRKFKVLYSTRKPTGVADMPPHVKELKMLKQAIDENASVVEMDDGADEDGQDEEVEPDLCFDFEGEDAFSDDSRMGGSAATNPRSFVTAAGFTIHADESRVLDEESNTSIATIQTVESGGSFTELLHSAAVHEGLEAFASTPRPSPLLGRSSRLQFRLVGMNNGSSSVDTGLTASTSPATDTVNRSDNTRGSRTNDQDGAKQNTKYTSSSNRLGGRDLAELRGTLGRKRAIEGDDELVEASYVKAKRVKAAKAIATLKQRLGGLEDTSGNMGGQRLRDDSHYERGERA
ncbi:hypothetical protein PI124_g22306 [Phytophthora idaei]|nr:hypothetical protein PI126_g22143 [Phytophthora idaei]KAG3232614.1 hypothetical protein PI124_g22306 [Phytophthora idaei]